MRAMRAAAPAALLVALAACTDSAVPSTTAPPVPIITTTTSAPPTTSAPTTAPAPTANTPPAPTTTTDPPAVTTTLAPTNTAPPTTDTSPPQPLPGSPHAALGSFRVRLVATLAGEDGVAAVSASSEGIYAGGAVACELTFDFGGLVVTESVVSIGPGAWLRMADDDELVSVPVGSAELQAALDGCPAAVGFWEDFDPGPISGLAGTPDVFNDIPARRIDASDSPGDGTALGLLGDVPNGVTVARFVVWVADDGDYLAGADVAFTMSPDVAEAEFGLALTGEVTFAFTIDVRDPDDPTLAVTPP